MLVMPLRINHQSSSSVSIIVVDPGTDDILNIATPIDNFGDDNNNEAQWRNKKSWRQQQNVPLVTVTMQKHRRHSNKNNPTAYQLPIPLWQLCYLLSSRRVGLSLLSSANTNNAATATISSTTTTTTITTMTSITMTILTRTTTTTTARGVPTSYSSQKQHQQPVVVHRSDRPMKGIMKRPRDSHITYHHPRRPLPPPLPPPGYKYRTRSSMTSNWRNDNNDNNNNTDNNNNNIYCTSAGQVFYLPHHQQQQQQQHQYQHQHQQQQQQQHQQSQSQSQSSPATTKKKKKRVSFDEAFLLKEYKLSQLRKQAKYKHQRSFFGILSKEVATIDMPVVWPYFITVLILPYLITVLILLASFMVPLPQQQKQKQAHLQQQQQQQQL